MSLNNEDIKQLIAILQRGLIDDSSNESSINNKPKKRRKKKVDKAEQSDTLENSDYGTSVIKTKKLSTGKFVNKFVSMPEANLHKEDSEFDKKVSKVPPTPRNRSFEYIKVRCRLCGKVEEVSPNLVESIDRYKCNKCCTMSG